VLLFCIDLLFAQEYLNVVDIRDGQQKFITQNGKPFWVMTPKELAR
jgi:hypothetical protein